MRRLGAGAMGAGGQGLGAPAEVAARADRQRDDGVLGVAVALRDDGQWSDGRIDENGACCY